MNSPSEAYKQRIYPVFVDVAFSNSKDFRRPTIPQSDREELYTLFTDLALSDVHVLSEQAEHEALDGLLGLKAEELRMGVL